MAILKLLTGYHSGFESQRLRQFGRSTAIAIPESNTFLRLCMGSFNNYMDMILRFFDYLVPTYYNKISLNTRP